MQLLKSIVPSIVLIALAIYARINFSMLPESLASALQYLPILLMFFVGLICLHFNQSRLFIFVLIVSLSYLFFEYDWLNIAFKYNVWASVVLIMLLLTVIFREQGIVSVRAIPLYALIVCSVLFALWVSREQPLWALSYINKEWLPQQYFDWTRLTQSNVMIIFITFIVLFSQIVLKQDNKSVTAMIVFATIVFIFHNDLEKIDLMITVSAVVLLCLITVLQESWRMAYLDELTQLPARRALREKLQSLVGIYTLAMVDVDFFKKFNDKYGHDIGDDVLKMIAIQLQKVSGGGTSYRYGGEEFTVVFANKSVEQVQQHLELLRENIANTDFIVNSRPSKGSSANKKNSKVTITVSIGACDSIDISSSQEVLKQADTALYKAKKKGRNCLVF